MRSRILLKLMRRPLNESLRGGMWVTWAAVIKDNLHLIYVRAVRERILEPAWEGRSAKNSQKDSIVATRSDEPQPAHVVPARMPVLLR